MKTFLDIALYSGLVFSGLAAVAVAFSLLGKFLTDISHDADAETH